MFSTVLTLSVALAIGQSAASSRTSDSASINATLANADSRAFPANPVRNVSLRDEPVMEDINGTQMFGESHSSLTEITSDQEGDIFATSIPLDATTINVESTEETTPASVNENLTKPGTVMNCFCDVDQVLVEGKCLPFEGGTSVIMQESRSSPKTVLTPMADRKAIIRDLVCDTQNGNRELTFSWNQFRLRDRGDILLMEKAGELNGLRSNDYCISHFVDSDGELTWTAKVCVAPPSVPRCCPPGKAMNNNVCLPSRTPEILEPPISADPYGSAVPWPIINNYIKPLNCTTEPMKDIPLKPGESYLAAHTDGLLHMWSSEETDYTYEYSYDTKYCVDGRQNLDGSTSYSVKKCFENPVQRHHRMCDDNVCVRKCCQLGEIMDIYLQKCVAGASEFAPAMNTNYTLIVGLPLEKTTIQVEKFSLLPDTGYLHTWDEWEVTLPPTDYCIDTFSDREGQLTTGALARIDLFTWWERTRNSVFSVCMLISVIFLLLIVACYATVPILLANAGKFHLCHVLSLIVAYSSGVALRFTNGFISGSACVALGILMQFGYLSAFFWLSVLCFDVWRLFRSVESKLRPPIPVSPYAYYVYAWGGPLVICSVTLILQYVDAYGMPLLIKPNLGNYKCWFGPDMEVFVFFYLYVAILLTANCILIAHTYWTKRKMDRSLAAITERKNKNCTRPEKESTCNRDVDSESILKFLLMSTCWITEILSWKIPPMEIWAVTDVINTLQGFFIFVIFMQDRRKRQHLKDRFSRMFG